MREGSREADEDARLGEAGPLGTAGGNPPRRGGTPRDGGCCPPRRGGTPGEVVCEEGGPSLRDGQTPETISLRDGQFPPPPGFLSRFAKVKIWRGSLPHWEHPGVAVFLTIRLGDSLPDDVIGPWCEERDEWLATHPQPWDEATIREYGSKFRGKFEAWLDAGHGSCILGKAENRTRVEDTLRFYDGRRYYLYAFVVMPNHVHVVLMPAEGEDVKTIVRDFKRFVSRSLSREQTWDGEFWQREYWDTLVRDVNHFRRVLSYVKANAPELAWSAYG